MDLQGLLHVEVIGEAGLVLHVALLPSPAPLQVHCAEKPLRAVVPQCFCVDSIAPCWDLLCTQTYFD